MFAHFHPHRVCLRSMRLIYGALLTLFGLCALSFPARADILVSNLSQNTIERYDENTGAHLGTITIPTVGPSGMAFGLDGKLYVGNFNDNKVYRLLADGTPDGVFASGINSNAVSLAFDSAGKLYVTALQGTRYIYRFLSDGTPDGRLDDPSTVAAPIDPWDVRVGPDGKIYVTEFSGQGGCRVFRYNSDGSFSDVFMQGLNRPTGEAFDSVGNFYVASYIDGKIWRKKRSDGSVSAIISGFLNPAELLFDRNGNLLVGSDSNNPLVVRYKYNAATDTWSPDTGFTFDNNFVGTAYCLALTPGPVSVSGQITLDYPDPSGVALTFEFRPQDGSDPFIRTATLDSTGTFSLLNIPNKNYDVWIKGDKWLAKVVAADATHWNVYNVNATLPGGDADNNNVVDFDDLTILAIAYNTTPGDESGLYDDRADFNGDKQVEFADLTILAINYNLEGDP